MAQFLIALVKIMCRPTSSYDHDNEQHWVTGNGVIGLSTPGAPPDFRGCTRPESESKMLRHGIVWTSWRPKQRTFVAIARLVLAHSATANFIRVTTATVGRTVGITVIGLHTGFVSSRNAVPVLFWSPERRSGPFRHIAAKFRFHLNENDKFALFGSKMPSASPLPPDQGLCPWTPLGAPPPDPHIGSRSRALSVPVLFLTGNEPCLHSHQSVCHARLRVRYSHDMVS